MIKGIRRRTQALNHSLTHPRAYTHKGKLALSNKNKSHPPCFQPLNSQFCVDKSGYSEVIGSSSGQGWEADLSDLTACLIYLLPLHFKEHNPRNTEGRKPYNLQLHGLWRRFPALSPRREHWSPKSIAGERARL